MKAKEKILYFELKTGAAGDMIMGALYGLLSEEQKVEFMEKVNCISDEIVVKAEETKIKGIGGIHMNISIRGKEEDEHIKLQQKKEANKKHEHEDQHSHEHAHEHATEKVDTNKKHNHGHHNHTSCKTIFELIKNLKFDDKIKKNALKIYQIIAEAEGKVHRVEMDNIHFHEIGSLDALVDVVGCCIAIELLQVDKIQSSPVCIGNGTVRCAHGVLPVPAPATAEIIKGMPVYMSSFDGELLTPTGAAIVKHFAQEYTKDMRMVIDGLGYGFGTKEFEQMTCVRAFIGDRF